MNERAPGSRALDWGRLVRLSLVPTALADALCGLALSTGGWPGSRGVVALLASTCLFLGGMALNDWADREHDALTRPDRPIPSGRVPAGAAVTLAGVLLALGVVIAASASWTAFALAVSVASAAVLYDTVARGAFGGPLLLSACRAGNLVLGGAIGAAIVGAELGSAIALPAVAYGTYVFVLSRLGRMEDDLERDPGARPRVHLVVAAALLALAPFFAYAPMGAWTLAAFVVSIAGASGLVREAHARATWTHAEVTAAMGLLLRRLALFTCALAFAAGAPWLGATILLAYPFGTLLRRVFPPS